MEKSDITTLVAGTRNVLVFGQPKTYKTRFACTAPKPIRYYDLDNGLLSYAKDAKPGEIECIRFGGKIDKIGKHQHRPRTAKPFEEFIDDFNSIYDLAPGTRPATVVIDSGTELLGLIMDFVLSRNSREEPVFQDWGQQMEKMREVIRAGVGLPCNFILVCHEAIDKDDMQGFLRADPMVTGKLAGEIGRFFDEVFRSEVVDGKDRQEPRLQTMPKGIVKSAGSRSSGTLPLYVEPTWSAIYGRK